MSSRVQRSKLLRISSEDRGENETNDDFSINLNNSSFVQNTSGIVVKSVSFRHNFPNLFNVGDSFNTRFTLTYNTQIIDVDVPAGWYTATELAGVLTTACNAHASITNAFTVALQVTPVPTLSRKFVFTASGGDTFALHDKVLNSMGDVLGITADTVEDAAAKTADSTPDLAGIKSVYICSNALSDNNMVASSKHWEITNVLVHIPVKVGFMEQIVYESFDDTLDTVMFKSSKNIQSFQIRLCTRSGAALPLDQYNLTLVLRVLPDFGQLHSHS